MRARTCCADRRCCTPADGREGQPPSNVLRNQFSNNQSRKHKIGLLYYIPAPFPVTLRGVFLTQGRDLSIASTFWLPRRQVFFFRALDGVDIHPSAQERQQLTLTPFVFFRIHLWSE